VFGGGPAADFAQEAQGPGSRLGLCPLGAFFVAMILPHVFQIETGFPHPRRRWRRSCAGCRAMWRSCGRRRSSSAAAAAGCPTSPIQ
jgi:hypothetical protein